MMTSLIDLLFCLLLMQSKRRFERDCKEAERAQHISDRIDLDNKTDGEKVKVEHKQVNLPKQNTGCVCEKGAGWFKDKKELGGQEEVWLRSCVSLLSFISYF